MGLTTSICVTVKMGLLRPKIRGIKRKRHSDRESNKKKNPILYKIKLQHSIFVILQFMKNVIYKNSILNNPIHQEVSV